MVHRFLRQWLHNERFIQQMADSAPMRRAARLLISGFFHLREKTGADQIADGAGRSVKSFISTFNQEYANSMKRLKAAEEVGSGKVGHGARMRRGA